jgi:hypothetical protein
VVIVPVARNVNVPVADQVVVDDSVMPPEIDNVPVDVNVQVAPVVVKDKQTNAPVSVIVGEPEALSIITASAAVGTEAPLEPPEAVDQLVVDDVFQVPVPPTQYLLAI